MDPQQPNPDPKPSKEAIDKMKTTYRSLDERLAIQEDDGWAMVLFKIGLRVLGIIVLILLSPFLLIGLLFAFLAAL